MYENQMQTAWIIALQHPTLKTIVFHVIARLRACRQYEVTTEAISYEPWEKCRLLLNDGAYVRKSNANSIAYSITAPYFEDYWRFDHTLRHPEFISGSFHRASTG
jgi:hypothetical protein